MKGLIAPDAFAVMRAIASKCGGKFKWYILKMQEIAYGVQAPMNATSIVKIIFVTDSSFSFFFVFFDLSF